MNGRIGWKALVGVSALALMAGACGDDEDEASTATTEEVDDGAEDDGAGEEAGEGADSEYCQLAAEFEEQEGFPTVEQIEAIEAVAPPEISENLAIVSDAFIEAIEAGDPAAAFADPAIEEAFGPIEAYEAEVCGLGEGEEEEAEQDPSVTEVDPDAAQVAVSGTEYAFDFEAPAAGPTSFTMANDGEETHFMLLVKLAEGATIEEALESEGDEGVDEEFESDIAAPGDDAVLTVDLTPGNWALLCPIPTPEGEPHFAVGMIEEFTIE